MVAFFNPDTGSEISRQLADLLEVLDGCGITVATGPEIPEGYEAKTVVNGVSPGGINVALEIAKARIDMLERTEQLVTQYGVRLDDAILVGYSMDYPMMAGQIFLVCSATLCVKKDSAPRKAVSVEAVNLTSIPRGGSLTERAMALAARQGATTD